MGSLHHSGCESIGLLKCMRTVVACKEIAELIDFAELAEALGLTEDQIVFYGALETNDNAVKVIPCGQLQGN